ncbi:hypothetical protein [Nostoc sp.]|uniref:hypothetical protein n=1 Tax=Nostoc sp. TaxID=1180 RepID=UPI002FF97CB2
MTAETVAEYDVVLCVGDTSFLDYGSIEAKKEGYGRMALRKAQMYYLQWFHHFGKT